MKALGVLLLNLLMLLYGMPLTVLAQESPEILTLPDGTVGEPYRVNIEAMLREKYHLKLETNARASVFRWALAQGEVPLGLIVRANGTIIGSPRVSRAEPYRFQLKVLDVSSPRGEALVLDFSLAISAPRIRLARIRMPRLVPTNGPEVPQRESEDRNIQESSNPDRGITGPRETNVETTGGVLTSTTYLSTPSRLYASMLKRSDPAPDQPLVLTVQDGGACDPGTVLGSLPSGKAFMIDARSGAARGKRQFDRGDTVSVVIDNKNPYLYKYTFAKDEKVVEETALGSFFSLIGGIVSDFAKGTSAEAKKLEDAAAPVVAAGAKSGLKRGADPRACAVYSQRFQALDKEVGEEIDKSSQIADPILKGLEEANNRRSKKYDDLLKELHNPRGTAGQLYCKSKELMAVPDPGASPDDIKLARKRIDRLREQAKSFKTRGDELSTSFPDCADMNELNRIRYIAEGLLSDASKYDDDLKKIEADLKKMNDLKKTVASAVSDSNNFREVHEFGPYSQTTEVSLALTRKVLSAPDGTEAKAENLVKAEDTKLKFGHAPFFSLSGGLVFSPLRKFEFERIQGFERDQQGNLVLVNGQPNLTTVVGLKETSRTRISPAIFLNGRLLDWNNQVVDGLHMSLGITAKNDNKGIDPEFLLGPSLSMLERKMFFTFGAYAGKQQKLTGGLFEGFAVPSTVTDLPIQKNYRWSFGFALSYQLPINHK